METELHLKRSATTILSPSDKEAWVPLRIGIIGAGKVGTAFGLFLKDRGECLKGYASRTQASAVRAAELTDSVAFQNPLALIREAELIFLTVVDDQIEVLARELSEALSSQGTDAMRFGKLGAGEADVSMSSSFEAPIFVHMSGAHGVDALEPLAAAGFETATLHPLVPVSEIQRAREAFGSAFFSAELVSGGRFEPWLVKLGVPFVRIETGSKALYHTGAVFASNFVVTLIDTAVQLFMQAGFSEEEAIKGLLPLVYGSVDNVARSGTAQALTGPIARGDVTTVEKHLKALEAFSDTRGLYSALSAATLVLAEKDKLKANPDAAAALTALLNEEDT